MRVAFRVDASVQIGTGHVMRCLALAEALKAQGHHCHFICRAHPGHLGDMIEARGFHLRLLKPEPPGMHPQSVHQTITHSDWLGAVWFEDAEQTSQCLQSIRVNWLVVDHYALDANWEKALAHCVDRILVIDDIADRTHFCDALLDQNLGRRVEDYYGLVPLNTVCLIGPEYALLRSEFHEWRQKSLARRSHCEAGRILVSLGGVDRTNVTGQVLAALAKTPLPPGTQLDIVMGATAPSLLEVRKQVELLPFEAQVSVNVTDMAERMTLADLSIGAAGSTSWERCCLGLPAIIVVLADNQRMTAEALALSKAAKIVDQSEIVDQLGKLVMGLIKEPGELNASSRQAASLCDGKGVSRLMSYMFEEAET